MPLSREEILVAGGGVGGLATALALARNGHHVTVIERDHLPSSATAEEAFASERNGAPQVHQTHGFLARIVVLLRERFPDILEALLDVGCATMPATAALGEPQPGDEDLAVLIVRRSTFEWVLRRAVAAEPLVELRTASAAAGLVARGRSGTAETIPVVEGLRLETGEEVRADIVVAATGRRGDVPGWLAQCGIEVPETVRESGLMYLSRWYRLPPHLDIAIDPKLGGDLGFVKYLAVPGDAGTLSVTLAIPAADRDLRAALLDGQRFDAACRALPGPNRFFGNGPLEPLGPVRPMGGLLNRLRRFLDQSATPTVLGFHAVGDAHTCTNPLYGRGCSLAFVQAVLLADAAATHPRNPYERTVAYEQGCKREVEPWFDLSVMMDTMGADPAGFPGTGSRSDSSPNGIAALLVASGSDPVIGRAMARFWNLLATPADLMADPEVMTRIAAVLAEPEAYPLPPREGPSRRELLAAIAA